MGGGHYRNLHNGFGKTYFDTMSADVWPKRCSQNISKIASHNRVRFNNLDIQEEDVKSVAPHITSQKKRVSRIVGGGLRQFSMIVCKKVESKGKTTYNEVADEIIEDFAAPGDKTIDKFDEKNIRRRVYDALNVLMAINVIGKEKKDIYWKGHPSTSNVEIEELEKVQLNLMNRMEKKASYLQELEEQILGLQNLMLRNPKLDSSGSSQEGRFPLPFLLVQTHPHARVEIEISEDAQVVYLDFNSTPFSLHDDAYVLKEMRQCCVANGEHVSQNSLPRSSSSSTSAGKSLGTSPFSWNSETHNA